MPYGNINVDTVTTSTTGGILGAGNASIMKNRLINSDMRIDQRNAGASVTPAANVFTYTADRWSAYCNQASKFTVQQNAGSVTPPTGFSNYLGATSSSAYSVTSTDIFALVQWIEGFNTADLSFGTANAKTVTLSFQVYSSLTGTFGGALMNSAQNRSYPFSYTVSSANTWTPISVTIAGDTTGTWIGATNGKGLGVWFSLGCGSVQSGTANAWAGTQAFQPTGSVSVVGTSGATFYITGVQLEIGSSATGFEYVNYQTSLANCQRYFWKSNFTGNSEPFAIGTGYTGTLIRGSFFFPTPMRTAPTWSVGTIGNFVGQANGSGFTITNYSTIASTVNGINFQFTSSSVTGGFGYNIFTQNADPVSTFSAEL